jgi:NodT family efflux transporter outer membrane factor (OMF) lipoprotein
VDRLQRTFERCLRRVAAASALWLLGVAVALDGCSQAPPLKMPELPSPPAFKEAGVWQPAQPADTLPRQAWWTLYGDPELDALQQRLLDHSADLAAALARYQQSKAVTDQVRAIQSPTLNASASTQRLRQSETHALRVLGPQSPDDYSSTTIGLNLQYEVDLWGHVRDQVAAGVALNEAARADLAAAQLSLQAQLADAYIQLRGLDRDAALLHDTVAAYTRALDLITQRHDGGLASGLDLARAQSQLEETRSQAQQSDAQRALIEHAIAALVGEAASSFTLAPRTTDLALPRIPTGLPSALLQRRPDIAAAQHRVVSANASLGVAKAAIFPTLNLGLQGGYDSRNIANLIQAPNTFWAVGPSLVGTLIDGGRRRAEVARVQAVLDEAGANYRSVVLVAFQQVEDNLALLKHYGAATESEDAAVAAAQRTLALANTRYREGAASYLDVVTAQTTALQSQRSALDLATRQRRANVALIRALGGGWTAQPDPQASTTLGQAESRLR